MITKEYGSNNKDVIIMLHGGGLSWWNYAGEKDILAEKYHLVIPILDGHSDSDKGFTSIEDNADELISLIDSRFNGNVKLICGLSLGGQVLLEMLSKRNGLCSYAIIESALAYPLKLTNQLIGAAVNMSYSLINKKWFSRLQFRSLKMKNDLFESYYRDTCKIKKSDMIAFMKANSSYKLKAGLSGCKAKVLILVGEKERPVMKKSAITIHEKIPYSSLEILNGCYHGELSINHADEYADKIKKLLG
ncbi:MAG: alpha/beta hydrolase [Oscillospiraceae bacterium]|nr:alpha/beta hydrolase [Oscillospiraceae bacterium]